MFASIYAFIQSLLAGGSGVGVQILGWLVMINGVLGSVKLVLDKFQALAAVDSLVGKAISGIQFVIDFLQGNLKH